MQKIKSQHEGGFTLIELLIVIGIMALMMGLAVGFLGNSFGASARKQSGRLIAVIKYTYNQASVTGRVHRIVFDLTDQSYWIEEGPEKVVVSTEEDPEKKDKKKNKKEGSIKEEKTLKRGDKKEDSILDSDKESEEPASEDEPQLATEASFTSIESDVVQKTKLGDVVFLRDVYVMHQKDIQDADQAYLYFFPNGMTEFAVIHLSNEDQDQNYSLIVNPVTGGVKVENDYIEHESLLEK